MWKSGHDALLHEDEVRTEGQEGVTAPYYTAEGIELYHGDCLEVLPQLRGAAVVTDPPYNVGFHYEQYVDTRPEREYLRWLKRVFTACATAVGPDGSIIWFWQGIRLANGHARACLPDGWRIHHVGAWFKQEFAGDVFKTAHPAYSWEPIIWAVGPSAVPKFYAGPGMDGRDGIIANHARHDPRNGSHPCPKPERAVRAVIQWVVAPGATVIDPFAGSATTLRAAKDLGRRAIGIEIDEKYCRGAVERLAQTSLFSLASGESA